MTIAALQIFGFFWEAVRSVSRLWLSIWELCFLVLDFSFVFHSLFTFVFRCCRVLGRAAKPAWLRCTIKIVGLFQICPFSWVTTPSPKDTLWSPAHQTALTVQRYLRSLERKGVLHSPSIFLFILHHQNRRCKYAKMSLPVVKFVHPRHTHVNFTICR